MKGGCRERVPHRQSTEGASRRRAYKRNHVKCYWYSPEGGENKEVALELELKGNDSIHKSCLLLVAGDRRLKRWEQKEWKWGPQEFVHRKNQRGKKIQLERKVNYGVFFCFVL